MCGNEEESNVVPWIGRHIYYFNMEFILVDGYRPRGENQYSLVCIQSVPCGFHSEQGQKGERCKEKNSIS